MFLLLDNNPMKKAKRDFLAMIRTLRLIASYCVTFAIPGLVIFALKLNKVKNDDKEITQPIEKGVRPRPVRPLLRRQTDI
jgi:hypothetical protein